jgi:hypothetical protein
MLRLSAAVAALTFLSSTAFSAAPTAPQWPQADVDKAVAIVKERTSYLDTCVKESGTELEFSVEQIDLNKDGVNEITVQTRVAELGKGAVFCFGRSGTELDLLISDGAGGWKHQFGFDMAEMIQHESKTDWPDLQFTGAGFCFPIWRYHEGEYGPWKVCNDKNTLIYAEDAKWVRKQDAVPSGRPKKGEQPEARMHTRNLDGIEFMHNGSLMAVDHERGLIIYKEPKASLKGLIRPGDVLVQTERPWEYYDTESRLVGIAYVYKKGCQPGAYPVKGGVGPTWHTIELKGEPPVWKKGTCEIIGSTKKSPNATLVFESVMD